MLNVLVVDDDEEFRDSIADALAGSARVACVATPVEALWALERTRIDVLICDLMLATTATGADVLELVRAQRPQVARILITGFGDHLRAIGPLAAHVVLHKPCDLVALRDLISRLPVLATLPEPAAGAAQPA